MQSQSFPDVVSPNTASPDAVSIAVPLTSLQARQVQHMATNVLVEAYASGTFPWHYEQFEYYLKLVPNRLESQQGHMLAPQTCWLVVYQFHAALESVTIRYAILGLALEHSTSLEVVHLLFSHLAIKLCFNFNFRSKFGFILH
ncbi:hypothetical protein BDN71DRAFT_1434000 [Pleurotus eryngii]|uniref:Uncharacterized protein n=1 Tax=Pleurotus eryngii TaxID=5323 RepID=A0A9P6DC54_PLEER|nr:hypothetical protein BDN71DRAFT_1434000 [Pleurotus eryngii]